MLPAHQPRRWTGRDSETVAAGSFGGLAHHPDRRAFRSRPSGCTTRSRCPAERCRHGAGRAEIPGAARWEPLGWLKFEAVITEVEVEAEVAAVDQNPGPAVSVVGQDVDVGRWLTPYMHRLTISAISRSGGASLDSSGRNHSSNTAVETIIAVATARVTE